MDENIEPKVEDEIGDIEDINSQLEEEHKSGDYSENDSGNLDSKRGVDAIDEEMESGEEDFEAV